MCRCPSAKRAGPGASRRSLSAGRAASRLARAGAAGAPPPWSAPDCRSGPESCRLHVQEVVPASFSLGGPPVEDAGGGGGEDQAIEQMFESQGFTAFVLRTSIGWAIIRAVKFENGTKVGPY